MVWYMYYTTTVCSYLKKLTLLFCSTVCPGEIVWSGDKLVGTDGFFRNGCDNVSDNYYPAASL